VRQFSPRGEKFDPNVHQAMFEVPNPSVPAGSVVEVVAPGYMIGERVLRPAMVGVSKGGPKVPPPSRSVKDNSRAVADES
jgi:molecular chaperone GrpE